MLKLLLPVLLGGFGVAGGVGAGLMLKPDAGDDELAMGNPCGDVVADSATADPTAEPEVTEEREYTKLNNQFIVPILEDGRVASMVILSLSVETTAGNRSAVLEAEPKLRDGFLQVLFNHANIGGFSGNFTSTTNMQPLRNELLRTARDVIGAPATGMLITDIVRQES